MIPNVFRKFIDSHKIGLGLMELPTSIGKTFSTFEFIAKYTQDWAKYLETHKKNGDFRQIIVVTPLKKNLQASNKESEELNGLEKAYNRLGRLSEYKEEVLFLDSLSEILKSNADLLEGKTSSIPNYLQQLECFQKLCSKVILMKSADNRGMDKEIISVIQKEAEKIYFEFRNKILLEFKKKNNTKNNLTLSNIAEEDGYSWLYQLYPDLLIPRVKVILMSFSKLLKGRVYENPSCAFMSDPFLKNKIIFIDEFDSTKITVKNSLAEEQAQHKIDFLQLFNNIYAGINIPWSSVIFRNIEEELKGGMYDFNKMMSKATRRRKEYKLDHAYQTDGVLREDEKAFIFKDNATITVCKSSGNLQIIAREIGERNVSLLLSRVDEMKQGDFFLEATIRWVTGFLKYFAQRALLIATKYEQQQNIIKNQKTEALISTEDALRTYLYKLYISRQEYDVNPQTKFLMNLADVSKISRRSNQLRNGYDYFKDGFTYYSLTDASHHDDNTIISMVDIPLTAESIIARMCNSALVLGLSATATIPSVTGNYNLDWLSENIEEYDDVVESSEELQKKVGDFLSERYAPYRDGSIKVNVNTLENGDFEKTDDYLYGDGRTKACAALSEFNCRGAVRIENIIRGSLRFVPQSKVNYCVLRYYNLLKVMRDFASKKHMQSLLYLGCKSVDENSDKEPTGRSEFDQFVIEKMVKFVNHDLGLEGEDRITVRYIYSKAFDSIMSQIRTCLSDVYENGKPKTPERVIIISAYQSVATGQNLQYKAPAKYLKNLIRLHPRGEEDANTYRDKDIDGIYLGDITHIVSNFSHDKISEKDLIMDIFQAEELNANWEISPEQKEENIKEAFKHLNESYPKSNSLKNCDSIRSERSRMIIQAVGRIGRSNQRCQEINIWIDSSVLNGLHKETLQRRFSSPEMDAILAAYNNSTSSVITNEQTIILNRANTISEKTASDINSRRRAAQHEGEWDSEIMQWWEEMREIVKKYPTATEQNREDVPFIRDNYIDNGKIPVSRYLFSYKYNDYKKQRVWFGSRETFVSADKDYRPFPLSDQDHTPKINIMSEDNSRLSILFKYPGLHEWWVGKGYADHIEPAPYIMSPFIYTEIYKGTLGETAGRFMTESETGLHLENIRDARKYEKADFFIAERPDEYIDFKHYSPATIKDGSSELQNVLNKLEEIGGKRMYIINTIKAGPASLPESADSFCDGRIVVIRWMIDEDGNINPDIKKKILYQL